MSNENDREISNGESPSAATNGESARAPVSSPGIAAKPAPGPAPTPQETFIAKRIRILKSRATRVPGDAQPRDGEEYFERAYRLGLNDGAHWIRGPHGKGSVEAGARLDHHDALPLDLHHRIARLRAAIVRRTRRLECARA